MEDILLLENNVIEEGVIDESGYEDNIGINSDISVSKSSIAIDELEKKESIDEREQIDKSDNTFSGSNDINNINSFKSVVITTPDAVNGFDSEILWVNPDISIQYNIPNIVLSKNFSDFDIIGIEYLRSGENPINNMVMISSDDLINNFNSDNSQFNYIKLGTRNNAGWFDRTLTTDGINTIKFDNGRWENIVYKIYGLNFKEVQNNPENPVIPSVSGNSVNNYYITVSGGNMISYNLLDKPLNEYTPTESMLAISILLALGVCFAILCRKAVLRWR